MKGYCYLDVDSELVYKSQEFIEVDNPLFWRDNAPFILEVWKFDTDDMQSMYFMYSRFKFLRLKAEKVISFTKTIDFDIAKLREFRDASNL